MKGKELSKLNNKGIFTVTQLSYTFRPRKKSKRTNPKSVKHHHSLKALAIREKRIFVIGNPDLNMTGTPVYLDVEGIPDQDFYYLIGLKVGSVDSCFQRSFWTDSSVDEEKIWRECTQTLVTIDNPQLFHYGSYETTFLNRMRTRYPPKADEVAIVDKLIEGAQNVLSVIYGHIYFPTYSNSLKDIASFLGYAWSMDDPSGHKSLLLRHRWELCHSTSIRQDLITYNAEDCEALEVVVKAVLRLIPKEDTSATLEHPDAVHTDTLKPEYSYNLGPVEFILPEFNYINKCSYWDYQRDRIYIRSNPLLRRVARKKQRKRGSSLPVNKTVAASWPWICPKCDARNIYKKGEHTKLLYDMRFSDGGVRRWVTKYVIHHYKCRNCDISFASDEYDWTRHRYGLQLLAYVIYNIIELHIPQNKVVKNMNRLFGYSLNQSYINRLKNRAVELYHETYEDIKQKLLAGKLVHADETHMSLKNKAGYVWAFTNMEKVIYVWSDNREGDIAREFLTGFKGVLVSDFYPGYDSIDCPQQKCLIHLIRDLNSYVLKEPFNEELKMLVHDFANILKPIIETIDRFGLKRYFLKKHRVHVTRFYERLLMCDYETETAQNLQKRFRKNESTLFTFLDHDGVPWNNNAEHAIKAFAALRDVIQGLTNERGIRDYLMLLSICQTCVYKGVSFLDFLRSGKKQIDEYICGNR